MPNNKKPFIIVLEGGDGVGKSTQVAELKRALKAAYPYLTIATYKFPNYESTTGKKIKEYLEGKLPMTDNDDFDYIKKASSLYAYNRFEFFNSVYYKTMLEFIDVLILDRYNSANLIHMSANLLNKNYGREDVATYKEWDEAFEFDFLKIPRPNITFYLDLEHEISLKNISKRNEENKNSDVDIHETEEHLSNIKRAKEYLNYFGFETIDIKCNDSKGNMLPKEVITEMLFFVAVEELRRVDIVK